MMIDCTPLHEGGGVQVAIALLDGLSKTNKRWIAAVPATMKLPDHLARNPNLLVLQKRGLRDFGWLNLQLSRLEASFRPDVVFTVFGPAYFKAKAPHLVGFALPNLVYPPEPQWPKQKLRFKILDYIKVGLLKRADRIVVETEAFRKRTSEALGIDINKIHVIGNSVNPILQDHFDFTGSGKLCEKEKHTIIIPSSWYPHKNLLSVVDVAVHLKQSFPNLDVRFQFTLPLEARGWKILQHYAEENGVGSIINTLGTLSLDQLAVAYRNSSIVYLPTLREASTAVYPEAFYFERPLVTTDIDFAHELCGEAALFVKPNNARETANSIAKLLTNPNHQHNLVDQGRKQLKIAYPSTEQKFAAQLDLMAYVSSLRSQKE